MDITKEFSEWKEKLTPVNAAKFVTGTIISCGAMAAVVAALKNPIMTAKGLTKWMMRLGIFVLGCKAGDIAEDYFNSKMDELIGAFNEAKEEANNESGSKQ